MVSSRVLKIVKFDPREKPCDSRREGAVAVLGQRSGGRATTRRWDSDVGAGWRRDGRAAMRLSGGEAVEGHF